MCEKYMVRPKMRKVKRKCLKLIALFGSLWLEGLLVRRPLGQEASCMITLDSCLGEWCEWVKKLLDRKPCAYHVISCSIHVE